MSNATLALLTANALLFVFAFLGFASVDEEILIVTAMLTMAMAVVNGVAHYRGRTKRPVARGRRAHKTVDEMDARTVLDIDARLEALERHERNVEDAERIQRMVDRGQIQTPEADVSDAASPEGIRERA